jgi:hypothetical protein
MSEFEENVYAIVGLSAFAAGKLPPWFTKRLDDLFGDIDDGEREDFDSIIEFIQGRWLGNWGTAAINGEEVVVLEHRGTDFELYKPTHLAEMLHCGFHVVEASEKCDAGTTVYLSERRILVPRRKAQNMVEA